MTRHDRLWHEKVLFGLHFDLHIKPDERGAGADLDTGELETLLRRVRPDFVQCDTKGHEGIASWPTTTGTPGLDLAKDSLAVYREVTDRLGIPLIAHHSGVWDEDAIARHPEWAVVGADGVPDRIATSALSEYDVARLIPQLDEVLGRYGLDGVWVDGENWGARPDWSARAEQAYRDRTGLAGEIPRSPEDEGWPEWLAFHRQLFRDHVVRYVSALHESHPNATVVSNWMYTLRQPDALTDHRIDYVSGDFTPSFGLEEALPEAAFLDSRGLSWDLMIWAFTTTTYGEGWTLKEAAQICQEAGVILSRGGVVALYDQPTRTGRHLPWHTDVLAAVGAFCRDRRWAAGGRNVADVLVLLDPRFHYASSDALFAYSAATDAVRGAAFALFESHRLFDIATFDDVVDLGSYRTVVVPEQGDVAVHHDRLLSYARAGGHLVITGVDVGDLLDGSFEEPVRETAPWLYVSSGGGTTPLPGPWLRREVPGAEVIATAGAGDFDPGDPGAGVPAVFRVAHGEGSVVVSGLRPFVAYFGARHPRTRALIEAMLPRAGARVEVDAPPWIGVTLREHPGRLVLHLLDVSSGTPLSPRNVSVGEVLPTPPIPVRMRVPGPVRLVSAAEGDMAGLPFDSDGDAIRFVVPPFSIHAMVVVEVDGGAQSEGATSSP